jgi:tight adherence protein C
MQFPAIVWVPGAAGLCVLGVFGLRAWREIRDALHRAELHRLASPPHWQAGRALAGVLAALPVLYATRSLGAVSGAAALLAVALGYGLAPQFVDAARRRVEQQVLDELALHLDLLAVAMETGSSWPAALTVCTERTPDGPLRRAWQEMIMDIHAGLEPLDALRVQEQRLRLAPLTTLLSALRAADKLQLPVAGVLRDRARQCAASRFARAERAARAAPLKLWAAMLLCLAPCSVVVLAFPLARLLAQWAG